MNKYLKFPRRWFIFIPGAILLVLAVLPYLLSPVVARRVEQVVRDACATCEFHADEIRILLLRPGHVSLRGVHFKAGEKSISQFEATVPQIELSVALWPLLQKNLRLLNVDLRGPDVVFTDGDGKSPPSKGSESEWNLAVEAVRVKNGEFHYVRNTHGTSATLNLNAIDLKGGGFATSGEGKFAAVKAAARLRLVKSGSIELNVSTKPFEKPLPIDVELNARDQNLADLTPFFKENAGVVLSGTLRQGHGKVKALGSHLDSLVWAEYEDLKVELLPIYDRSEAAAFFTNLGMAVAMVKKNGNASRADQVRATQLERKPEESIVHFILTGLKLAALQVTLPALTERPEARR